MTEHTRKLSLLTAVSIAVMALSACQTTSGGQNLGRVDAALDRNAGQTAIRHHTPQSLATLEQAYKRNSNDETAVVNYVAALRQAGYYQRADLVLSPFVNKANQENTDILIEYASLQSAMGNYMAAESAARKAVLTDTSSGRAYHVLGVALDAQGHHKEAKTAFEKGLDNWEGDPSPILNNMGLNLAALGFIDDAIEVLRRALATAPNRTEIERNLRIVSALQYQPASISANAPPVPQEKPVHN